MSDRLNPTLAVKDLTVVLENNRKEEKHLVSDINFEVYQHEMFCIVGESGCGKSMTCLAITGLLPTGVVMERGTVFLHERRIDRLAQHEKRAIRGSQIALILQNPMSCFDPLLTVEKHFRETLAAHKMPYNRQNRQRIGEMLIETGFDNPEKILKAYPFQLSGGMLQCVMIALALFFDVSVIIADEPTTDLDMETQNQLIRKLVSVKKRRPVAIVLVTHDLHVVSQAGDRVMIMRKGKTVEQCTVTQLFTSNREPYTHQLVEAYRKVSFPFTQYARAPKMLRGQNVCRY